MLAFRNLPNLKRRFTAEAVAAEMVYPPPLYLADLPWDHYPTYLGLPTWLIYAESMVRVGIPDDDRPDWIREFLGTVPLGIDDAVLERAVLAPLMVVALRPALAAVEDAPGVAASVRTVIDLWQRDDLRSAEWCEALQAARETTQAAVTPSPLRWPDGTLVPGQDDAAIRHKVSKMAAMIAGEGKPALNAVVGSLVFARFSRFDIWAEELVRLLRDVHAKVEA